MFNLIEAIGCADPAPPLYGTMRRMSNDVIMMCNNDTTPSSPSGGTTGGAGGSVFVKEQWHLTCEGDQWIGTHRNCTSGG